MAKPVIQVNMHYHSIYKINFDALNIVALLVPHD